jgi:hypothetical protein
MLKVNDFVKLSRLATPKRKKHLDNIDGTLLICGCTGGRGEAERHTQSSFIWKVPGGARILVIRETSCFAIPLAFIYDSDSRARDLGLLKLIFKQLYVRLADSSPSQLSRAIRHFFRPLIHPDLIYFLPLAFFNAPI